MDERIGWLQWAARLAMVSCILVVLVSVCLPNTDLAWMRDHWDWFNRPMGWIENAHSPINLVHLILFLVLGASIGLAQPRWHPGWILAVIAALGIVTELLQLEIPGRHPRIADAVVDVVGAAVGLLVIKVMRTLHQMAHKSTAAATIEDAPRLACISLLRDDVIDIDDSALADMAPEALLAAAEREGVVSLLAERLHAIPTPSPAIDRHRGVFAEAARREAARNLLCQAQCRAITKALDEAGIDAIWMKGAALSQWLYASPHLRDLADIDLLLPDHASTLRATEVLAPLGYCLPNPCIAGDLVVHELLAWSERAQLELDLHWRLCNDALLADRLQWQELRESAIELPALGPAAIGLAPVHALLHACMHRALNYLTGRENRLRWLYDIHLLAARLSPMEWEQVVSLAASRGLAGACHDGLVETAATFNTQLPEATMHRLAANTASEWLQCPRLRGWRYFQWATWRSLPDTRTGLRWLRQLLFPDMAHLRARYGSDGARRMTVLFRRLTDGWKRWRRYGRNSG